MFILKYCFYCKIIVTTHSATHIHTQMETHTQTHTWNEKHKSVWVSVTCCKVISLTSCRTWADVQMSLSHKHHRFGHVEIHFFQRVYKGCRYAGEMSVRRLDVCWIGSRLGSGVRGYYQGLSLLVLMCLVQPTASRQWLTGNICSWASCRLLMPSILSLLMIRTSN